MIKKASLVATITLAGLASGHAAPVINSVNGIASQGSTISISGSGFGSKPTAAPVLWDDFEQGTAGTIIQNRNAAIGKWDTGSGSENVRYSTSTPYAGRMAAEHDFVSAYNASLSKNFTFQRLYMDFWIYTDYRDKKSRNFKPWRFYGGSDDSLQLVWAWYCDGQALNRYDGSGGLNVNDWPGNTYPNRSWQHVQVIYQQSDPNKANGTVRHLIDGVVSGLNSDAVITRASNSQFNQIRIGHYWAQDAISGCPANSGATVKIDNVYIDTSWARVELGNASTYAASRVREVQIPVSWSSNQVQVKLNAGRFTQGDTAYLYVTDVNNVTNTTGIPVVIGASSDGIATAAPQPPTSVTVQ